MERPLDEEHPLPFRDLCESGILWLINREVFHPRGFALALVSDEKTGEALGWNIQGDGEELWSFPADVDERNFERIKHFLKKKD